MKVTTLQPPIEEWIIEGMKNRSGPVFPSHFSTLAGKYGAPRRIRTADLLFTKQLLYQLSYWGPVTPTYQR